MNLKDIENKLTHFQLDRRNNKQFNQVRYLHNQEIYDNINELKSIEDLNDIKL